MTGWYAGTDVATGTAGYYNLTSTSATDTLTITAGGAGGYTISSPDYIWYGDEIHAQPRRVQAPKEFNKYINASDLIEEFIKFAGVEGLKAGEVLELPMELFIKWLVIRACEEDKEEPNVTLALPGPPVQPRCLGCGQWMRVTPAMLHTQRCAEFFFSRN